MQSDKIRASNTFIRSIKTLTLLTGAVLCLTGCFQPQPQVIVKTEYKEVPVPVRCQLDMPEKPYYSKNNPLTSKAMTEYYLLCEDFLKICLGLKNNNGATEGVKNEILRQ